MSDATDLNRPVPSSATGRDTESRSRVHRHRAYGMAIRSDLALPELDSDDGKGVDLTIRLRPTGRPLPDPSAGAVFEFDADTQYLAWSVVGGFLMRSTREIDIEPAPGVDEPLLHLPLLGPVLALLLHLRGMLVLHASAISIGGRGAIFLGDKRAGKSTTAAALVAAGHRLLADDIVAIDSSGGSGPLVVPGFPQLKLDRDDGKGVIGKNAEAFPLVLPDFEKRQHRLNDDFSHDPVAPASVYILERGSSASLTPLAMQEALMSLMRFSYVTRFRPNLLTGHAAATHLKQCAALAGSVRTCRLAVPGGLDRLDEVVRLVEADLA